MSKLLIEPHYLGSVEYFCLLQNFEKIEFEIHDTFLKQTYRNRAYILGSNKILSLNIPLKYSNRTSTKDVRLDYSQRWIKDHWGAIYSSYGKAPFFEFFASDFKKIWEQKLEFLLDLNLKMITLCFKLANLNPTIDFTSSYQKVVSEQYSDLRNAIHPKISFSDRNIYRPITYSQLFGNSFVPNLSIIDLILCEGPRTQEILKASFKGVDSNKGI